MSQGDNNGVRVRVTNIVNHGSHYVSRISLYLFLVTFLVMNFIIFKKNLILMFCVMLLNHLKFHFRATILIFCIVVIFLAKFYFQRVSRNIYLVDFACYKPDASLMCSKQRFMDCSRRSGAFTDENLAFQKKVMERSGLGEKTYFSEGLLRVPAEASMRVARNEAEAVMFGAIDELLSKVNNVEGKDIKILVLNCSTFNPTPSLCSGIVNRYKLRSDIRSYNLNGMGCSAGITSIDLAKRLLQVHPNCYALVMNLECSTQNWYRGNDRSMLVSNCIFRMGGAAILLSNRSDSTVSSSSKYQLTHTVRSHTGANDSAYNSVLQQEDGENIVGIKLSRQIIDVAANAIKSNITALGPLVLPVSEQLLFLATMLAKKVLKMNIQTYIPDFKLAFEHFCIHAGGPAVLDAVEKSLKLTEWHMEPSRMSLYRFGNTSSCSVWYELAYAEAKGRIKKGDRVWQIAFGSGFKCSSCVWRALTNIDPIVENNPWTDEINDFPVCVPKVQFFE